jgi:hypothetical protein
METEDILNRLKQITHPPRKVTVLESFILNWKSHLVILICVYILSDKFLKGYFTLNFSYVLWYIFHIASHVMTKTLPISTLDFFHEYHHQNDSLIALFVEIFIVEFGIITVWSLLYYSLFDPDMIYLDPWIITFYTLMYVTIHNVNYSYLRVNNTHYQHHQECLKNIGPDICDIIFDSKADDIVEDTDHFIPNAIFITFALYFLKQNVNNNVAWYCLKIYFVSFTVIAILFYLYHTNPQKFFITLNKWIKVMMTSFM